MQTGSEAPEVSLWGGIYPPISHPLITCLLCARTGRSDVTHQVTELVRDGTFLGAQWAPSTALQFQGPALGCGGTEMSIRGYVHEEMIFPGNKGSKQEGWPKCTAGEARDRIGGRMASEGGGEWGVGEEELEPRRSRAGLAEPCREASCSEPEARSSDLSKVS